MFHEVITTAVRNKEIVNMATPPYDVQVVDMDGNQYGSKGNVDEREGYPYDL